VGGATWVLVVLAAALVLVALLVFLVPLARGDRDDAGGAGSANARPTSSSGSLARGFGYLSVSPRSVARRGGVHERFSRAFARVDAVDPHAAPRRIGEALVQAGLADAAPPVPTSPALPPDMVWRSAPAEQPRDVP